MSHDADADADDAARSETAGDERVVATHIAPNDAARARTAATVVMARASARDGDPRTGSLVFGSIGTFAVGAGASASASACGYASTIAVSGKYGYFVVASGSGAYVVRTHEASERAAAWKADETAHEKRVLDSDASVKCARGGSDGVITIVAMTPDERVFATCDDEGVVEFYAARDASDGKATGEKFGEMTLAKPVRALKWCSNNASFMALAADALVYVEGVGKEPKEVAVGATCVSARGNDVLAWASGDTVFIGSSTDPLKEPKDIIEIGPYRDEDDTVEVDGVYAVSADKFLVTAHGVAEPDDCFLACVSKEPSGEWVRTRLDAAFDIDPEVVDLPGPVLSANGFSPWNVVFATHRKAWDNQLLTLKIERDSMPCVYEVEDDRCFATVPMTVDDDNNYVTGLGVDLTGAGGTMLNPQDASAPELPKGPTLIVATTDGRISILSCANLNIAEAEVGAQFIKTQQTLPTGAHPAMAGASSAPAAVAPTMAFGFAPPASSAAAPAFSFAPLTSSAPAASPPVATPPVATPPAFSFKPATEVSTPAFTFQAPGASTPAAVASTPAFSFKTPEPASAPVFSFKPADAAKEIENATPPVASTPAFSFKPVDVATPPVASTPAFSFKPAEIATPPVASTPAFSFKPAGSAAAPSATPPVASTPAFSFKPAETATPPVASTPAFSFKPAEAPVATPSVASTPAFSFKAPEPASASVATPPVASAPAFSFTPATSDVAKAPVAAPPAFSFKPTETPATPSAAFSTPIKAEVTPPRSTGPPKPTERSDTGTPKSPIDKGMELLQRVKIGEIDMDAAATALQELLIEHTPTKDAKSDWTIVMAEKFTPIDTSNSPAVNLQSSPLPSWGVKLAEIREAKPEATEDGLQAIENDMRKVIDEVGAMLEDVQTVTKSLEASSGALLGKADIEAIASSSSTVQKNVVSLLDGSNQLRSRLNELWAANSSDEALRSELESLISSACEEIDEASAAENDTRELSPALKEVQENMHLDMRSVLDMAAELEASVERLEAAKREASRPKPKAAIRSGLVSSAKQNGAGASAGTQTASIMKAIATQATVIEAQAEKLNQLLECLTQGEAGVSHVVSTAKQSSPTTAKASPPARKIEPIVVAKIQAAPEPFTLKTPVHRTSAHDTDTADGNDLESVIRSRIPSTRVTTIKKVEALRPASPIAKVAQVVVTPPTKPVDAKPTSSIFASASAVAPTETKAAAPTFSFAPAPVTKPAEPAKVAAAQPEAPAASAPAAPVMGFSADFLKKANSGYQKAQEALEKELASGSAKAEEPEAKAPEQKFSFGIPAAAPTTAEQKTEETKPAFAAPPAGGFSFGIPAVTTKSDEGKKSESDETKKPAFSFTPPKLEDSKLAETPPKAEAKEAAPTMAFSADFLAKANQGYAAAQKALEEDLAQATPPPGTPPASSAALTSSPVKTFDFASATTSSAAPKFGISTASSAATATSETAPTKPAFGISTSGTSTNLFGSASATPASAPAFGASAAATSTPATSAPISSGFGSLGFGSSSSAASGESTKPGPFAAPAFGAPPTSSAASSSAFGAVKASTGFGSATSTPAASSSSFGAAAATSTPAFGASSTFGASATATSSSAFGATSSSFGAAASTSTPAFGAPSAFGAAAQTSTPAFGAPSAFGAAAQTSTPAFGAASAFGAAATTSTPAFGAPSAFGAAAATSKPAFGAPSSGFGQASGFGAAVSTSTPAFGAPSAFGAAASTSTPAFGAPSAFGATAKPGGGFGASATMGGGFAAAATAGGGFGAAATAGSGFGAAATSGGGFGAAATAGSGFGAAAASGGVFGAASTSGGGFGAASGGFGQPASGGFGAPTSTGAFGQPTPPSAPSSGFGAFGAATQTSAFGAPAPGFGQPASGFGQTASGFGQTQQPQSGGFGAFGAQAQQPQPGFGAFGAPQSPTSPSNPAFTQMRR